jgi:hypothetical protein
MYWFPISQVSGLLQTTPEGVVNEDFALHLPATSFVRGRGGGWPRGRASWSGKKERQGPVRRPRGGHVLVSMNVSSSSWFAQWSGSDCQSRVHKCYGILHLQLHGLL